MYTVKLYYSPYILQYSTALRLISGGVDMSIFYNNKVILNKKNYWDRDSKGQNTLSHISMTIEVFSRKY